jgi:tRNA(fMet)-specific endonuclease VapC
MDRGGAEGENIRARLATVPEAEVAASIVSYEEQMRGWLAHIAGLRGVDRQVEGYRQLERLLGFYCDTHLLPFDEKAVDEYQRLWLARIRVGTMDLKIAAIALANNATLLTRNRRDFERVPALPSKTGPALDKPDR